MWQSLAWPVIAMPLRGWRSAESILRSCSATSPPLRLPSLLTATFVFGITYGAVMGTFAGLSLDRWQQILFSALKVPLLLLVSFLLSVPSFYVFNAILGLSGDF